jgi:acyl-CoA reductase-like NAD-dependent aldehyde dehydrogenase
MKDRDRALKPYQRSAILIHAAVLLGERLDAFARFIAQEGGKPLTDARIEAIRAVDSLSSKGGYYHAARFACRRSASLSNVPVYLRV